MPAHLCQLKCEACGRERRACHMKAKGRDASEVRPKAENPVQGGKPVPV